MSVIITYMISFREEISNRHYHHLIRAAARVHCFVRFAPSGQYSDIRVALTRLFRMDIDDRREVIFSISSNPYDPVSHYLYDREMLDENGDSDDQRITNLAKVLQQFLLGIKGADHFLLICSEGEDILGNFSTVEVNASQVAEHLIAIYLCRPPYFPSIALHGSWD